MRYEPVVTFARIIDVYVGIRGKDLGTTTCQAIVRSVTILDGHGDDDEGTDQRTPKMGNIIRLYNLVFVPIMKSYLLHNKPLRRNAAVLRKAIINKNAADPANHNDGSVSVAVREGNVSLNVTLLDNGSSNDVLTTTQMLMVEQQRNDITRQNIPGALPEDRSECRTFLRFGRASGAKVK